MTHDIWIWAGVVLTLFIFSSLYKDNPFYRFAERLFIGATLGYAIALTWHNVIIPKIVLPLQHHEYILIIPLCFGLLYFSRFFPKQAWLSRWPMAFAIGTGTGISLPLVIQASLFKQLQGTMITSFTFSNIVLLVGVITTLTYFFFSTEHKGAVGKIARIGIWFIMVSFGAAFGYTVMARVSLLIGRFQFLLHDWLGLIK
ncbi:MAG: hypothetical protein HY769_00345 [Candidatus Stahlbacteria bacterium]|nr:hypothetical protein [Candidatus Stahlbacteria bacterium]